MYVERCFCTLLFWENLFNCGEKGTELDGILLKQRLVLRVGKLA